MYTDDFKNIVLEDFYLNDKISNTENYHNIKKWLRYQLFPCRDADFVLRNKTILTKLNWPIDNNKIYIDCIFSMKTYFNMFLRMYNLKSSQSYAWLLTYFDDIFSYKHIQEFCKKHSILITEFYSCMVSAKYSCGFSNTLISSIIVGERYLNYFTTITEDRLWQLLAKPVFRWRNRSGLSMNAAKAV